MVLLALPNIRAGGTPHKGGGDIQDDIHVLDYGEDLIVLINSAGLSHPPWDEQKDRRYSYLVSVRMNNRIYGPILAWGSIFDTQLGIRDWLGIANMVLDELRSWAYDPDEMTNMILEDVNADNYFTKREAVDRFQHATPLAKDVADLLDKLTEEGDIDVEDLVPKSDLPKDERKTSIWCSCSQRITVLLRPGQTKDTPYPEPQHGKLVALRGRH